VKQATRVVLSVVLTAAFLFLFLRSFDLGTAWTSLLGASVPLVALSAAINLVAFLLRAWRWRHLLAPLREGLGLYNLTSTTLIGFTVSYLVPFRVGEVVRPVLLARRERLNPAAAIATVALERLFDMVTVMGLFLVFALSQHGAALMGAARDGDSMSQAAIFLRKGVFVTGVAVFVGLPLLVLLVAFPERVVALLHWINPGHRTGRIGKAISILETFLGGLRSVRRGKELALSILLSVAMWLTIDLGVYFGLRAFGLPLHFFDTLLLMVPIAVGIAVPTPGGVGSYEFLCQISLVDFWGVERGLAAAVAVTLHAVAVLPTVVLGLLLMWRDGIRPAEVRSLAAGPAAPGASAAVGEEAR
jgi:hypothetical protein